ncbi:glycosyltransferase [Leucobacter massiliensis]|uniref:D-inositol 3-phosphate glycosyltransferase n=1 Tax=Leucobacter massiliensis TaxID=1686285 RepID=A0A2S9QKA7_9MICO|nr:glycosyltransferase [Leucobacter massiliensis]PRI10015.1 glycosyl transferase [Leucobacter massiliensis]
MRIAMVSEHASPLAPPGSVDSGGQNVHVAALARHLGRRGHTVTVFTRRDDPDTPTRVALDEGVEVVQLSAGPERRIPKDALLPYMGPLAAGLASAWSVERPDLVHAHFWMSGLAALGGSRQMVPTLPRPPILQTFHALGSVKRRCQGVADTSPGERARLEPLVGRQADTVIATCADEVEELRALGVDRGHIEVAPCGVDPELFTPRGEAERRGARFRLLSIGRLVPRKGVDTVMQALARLRDFGFGDDVELVIAGTGAEVDGRDRERTRLASLAAELGVSGMVRFRGAVAREDMPALLRSAHATVCAPWYEPFGIVPLESMACGTPVVAARVGGLQNSVVDGVTGLLVPPRDPGAVACAVARLLTDERLRAALGAAGRERVEALYGWDRVAERTERIYERAIARDGGRLARLAGAAQ